MGDAGWASDQLEAGNNWVAGLWRRLGSRLITTVSGLLLAAVAIGVIALNTVHEYSLTRHNAERTAANLAHVLAAQTEEAYSTIDQMMRHAEATARTRHQPSGSYELYLQLNEMAKGVPFLRSLDLFDKNGNLIQSSFEYPMKVFNINNRDYFIHHATFADNKLFVGEQLIGKRSGSPVMTLSRRLEDAEGNFIGVMVGVLDPSYLQLLYETIDIGHFGVVTLVRSDGRMIVRSPNDPNILGRSLANTELFDLSMASKQNFGIQRGRYYSDGRLRIIAYQKIPVGSLLIRVALDEHEVFAGCNEGVALTFIGVILFSLTLAFMIHMLRAQFDQRDRAEAARMESERLAIATIDALTAQLCVLDEIGEVIVVNRAWRQFCGTCQTGSYRCGRGANYLKVCDDVVGPEAEEARRFADGIRAVMSGLLPEFSWEYPCPSLEGPRWFVGRATRFASDGPVRVVVIHHDVSERKQVEISLRESERRLAKAQAIAHLGNWEEDLISHNVWWSDEVFRIFGRSPKDFGAGGIDYLRFVHPDDRFNIYEQERRLVSEGTPINLDHRILLPDGSVRLVNLQAELLYDNNNKPVRTVGTVLDITERKMAELELREAVRDAAIANSTKNAFLSNMSHELNTPLNAVIGFSEMMADQSFGPLGNQKYLQFSKTILSSGRQLQQIISDILDLTKIDAGEIALCDEELNVANIIAERVRHMRPGIEAASLVLQVHIPQPLLAVVADRHMIKQMLRNLLSNAIKFTPEHGEITVSAERVADGRLCLSVSDTGVGMAAEDIPRALERFSQVNDRLDRCRDGAGLGLALTKLMIEKHDGSLDIASEPGYGTTVNLWFPAERVCEQPVSCVDGTVMAEEAHNLAVDETSSRR